jgi:hypothetical protein
MSKAKVALGVASLVAGLGLAVVGTTFSGVAFGGGNGPQGSSAPGKAALTSFKCDGGAQKEVKNRMIDNPFTFSETTPFINVPGAGLNIGGPASGSDTLVITFSGETQLTGSTGTQDWVGLQVLVDGAPVEPHTPAGDVMALTGEPTWNLNSGTFCTKVGPGNHNVQVQVNTADNDTNDTLNGWVDDYTLSVERSQ